MRKWFIILSILIVTLVFLPKLASTSLGKPLFVRALEAKTGAKVDISNLSLSWLGPQKFYQIHWTHSGATGTIEELQIQAPFWSFKGPFQLKNGSISYLGGTVEQIEGQILGNDFQLTGLTHQGHISLDGKVYAPHHFNIAVDIQNFPLLAIDQRLDHIFGPTLNLKGTVNLNQTDGPIDLALTSQNITTQLYGTLTQHAITLREPLIANIQLTPELSALLLRDANPLFLTGLTAKNPIALNVATQDAHFPLPFSLQKLSAQGTLDLGQTVCQTGASLASIISLLKGTPSDQLNAWFTPLPFHLAHGTLETGRMDVLLADSIHICTWGDIDLIHDEVHMFLGLPAGALRKSFGIRNLPDTYVMKLPIRGSTRDPEIVKGPAITKIAALVASQQISKKGYLGNIADLFSRPKDDSEAPAAHRPFPWEVSQFD
jgi:hypothetical protein